MLKVRTLLMAVYRYHIELEPEWGMMGKGCESMFTRKILTNERLLTIKVADLSEGFLSPSMFIRR